MQKNSLDQKGTKVIGSKEFYKSLEDHYYQFLKFADKQIDIQIDILNILRSLTDKNENIDIRKNISKIIWVNFKIYINRIYISVIHLCNCSTL